VQKYICKLKKKKFQIFLVLEYELKNIIKHAFVFFSSKSKSKCVN
jgi:hypothetical protein